MQKKAYERPDVNGQERLESAIVKHDDQEYRHQSKFLDIDYVESFAKSGENPVEVAVEFSAELSVTPQSWGDRALKFVRGLRRRLSLTVRFRASLLAQRRATSTRKSIKAR